MANGQTDTVTFQDLSSLLPSGAAQSQSSPPTQQPSTATVAQTQPASQAQPSEESPVPFEGGLLPNRPLDFGLRVATPDFVQKFGTYMQNGGDINKIPIYDQIGVALAKDPDFFKKNPDAFYDYVYKPLQQQQQQDQKSWGQQFNEAIGQVPSMLYNAGKDLVSALVSTGNQQSDAAELAFRKATGMTHDQAYQDLVSRLATENATEAQGIARALTTNQNLVLNTVYNLAQGTKPVAKLFANDPASQEQIDKVYSRMLLNKAAAEQQFQDFGKVLQSGGAQAYKLTGYYSDLGQKMETASANPAAASGLEMIYNPLNYLGIGEGAAATGAARPIFFERGMDAVEDLAGASAKKAALDITQILPERPELNSADPAYIPTRNLQAQLMPEARSATQDVADAQQVLNSRLTALNKISGDPGTVTSLTSNLLQQGGAALQTLGQGVRKITEMPENLGNWIAGGNQPIADAISDGIRKYVFGAALHVMGPIGGAVEAGIEHLPDIADTFSGLFKTMGQELTYADNTIPYWTRVAMQNKLVPKGLASFLDSPLVQTATGIGKGGAAGAATGAAIGGLSGGIPGAVGGFVQGGILGMAGGGFGQWQRFQNPNQYLLAARSDWMRYRDLLSPTERQQFDQLSPTNQIIIGQTAQHFPGLRIDYFNNPNGARGMHYVDQGGASHIQVNVANPDSAIAGIAAHEFIHAATHSGMVTDLYDTHFGNPQTGETGQFTALDPQGKPIGIDPVTQRYIPNQDFQNLKAQYLRALSQSGVPTAHLNDFAISREIYAEHGVDYLMSGGALLDSNSAFRPGLYSASALKTALAKIGYTFDEGGRMIGAPNGTISGTGLFNDLQRNPTLGKFAQAYFGKQWRDGLVAPEEQQPTHQFTKRDLQNPNTTETWLNNAPEIMRNQDGTAMRDPNTGQPIMRTPREVKDYNANFADSLRKGLDSLPEDQRMDFGYRKTTSDKGDNYFVRYLPDNVLDSLAATNQYNPHQIASLRMLSRVLADKGNPGMEMRFFYRTATTPSKKYGTFAGTEKLAVPYGFEITHDNNVNIKSVDFNQLSNNYLRVRNREPYKSLWNDAGEFAQDAHTYFTNHKEGRPGADAIGEQKRNAINSLAGFGTQVHQESNPLVGTMPQSVRPIIKSYAIDRANQISPTGFVRPFVSEEQYYKANRNYLPR